MVQRITWICLLAGACAPGDAPRWALDVDRVAHVPAAAEPDPVFGDWGSPGSRADRPAWPACPVPAGAPELLDVTDCAGITATHVITDLDYYAIGQAWGDYDGDGRLDLYVTDMGGPNSLYRNLGNGAFARVGGGLADVESAGATFVDYDNDGDADLYVLNRGPNVLFRNDGEDGFTDVTAQAGVGDAGQGQGAAWGDFDGDGWLDLYVVNWMLRGQQEGSEDTLYRSARDGTFEDVTDYLPDEAIRGAGFAATFADVDSDGDLDLYVVNDKGYPGPAEGPVTNRNVLFRNDGAGCAGWCFAEVGRSNGADARLDGMGLATGDYDGDGDLDFYVTDSPLRSVLLRNRGDGSFDDVAEGASVWGRGGAEWGTVFVDYDHDGALDLFVAAEGPSSLMRNRGDGTFEDVSVGSGIDYPGYTLGVAYADYDDDGHVDLVVGERGIGYRLFRNTGRSAAERHWLTVRLVGGGPVNRDAIGARVVVHTTDGRSMMREVKCGSSLGAGNDLASHFGLGDAAVDTLEVRWPDGRVDHHRGVARDTTVIFRYGS